MVDKLDTKGVLMNRAIKLSLVSIAVASSLYATGYKIPEQSFQAVALSNANIAGVLGADSSYYNPANMAFIEDKGALSELSMTYIHLPEVDFEGSINGIALNTSSKSENFLMPTLHLVTPKKENLRFGLSLTTPAGLAKRWEHPLIKATSEEFSLRVFELNPTFGYKLNDQLAVGGGVRFIYSDGKVRMGVDELYYQNMHGQTDVKFGYNLALSYKPIEDVTLSAIYRSEVKLVEDGDAFGFINSSLFPEGATPFAPNTHIAYSSKADTALYLPAEMHLALAYNILPTTKVEFVFERDFWSALDKLQFNFKESIPSAAFGSPHRKDWKDANAYRVGVSHRHYNMPITTYLGFAYDETSVPESTFGFELPSSNVMMGSIGAKYEMSDKLSVGMAYLLDYHPKREISKINENGIVGEIPSGVAAHLVNLAVNYKF